MDLSLTETQQLIQDSTRDFVRNDFAKEILLDLDEMPIPMTSDLWTKVSQLGWMGMAIPEEYGGTGNTLTDVAVLYEELGRGPVPGPLFSSGVLGALILLKTANSSQKEAWLPGVADGTRILAIAATEKHYGWSPAHIAMTARRDGDDYVLDGTKLFVHDAASATDLLVLAKSESGISLLRVDANANGIAIRVLPGFLSGVTEVTFDDVHVPSTDLVGTEGAAWAGYDAALQSAIPVLCAYKVGACQALFELCVDYSKERTQFGQPIGKFQRVQDHIIHIVNYLDAARWTTNEALWKLDTGQDATSSVHMAKALSSDGYLRSCDFAHEVHAGIGVMREYGLTLHTKMSRSLYHCLGAPKYHRKRMEGALGLVQA
jgi:alkylation response protein AidB-like acyl-CoA dehydrogenase